MAIFLTSKPFFSKKLSARTPAIYLFELVGLLFLFSAWLGLDELKEINKGFPIANASASAIALIGVTGLYGIRVASWIAIFRHNRMPQTAEWLVCLIPLTAMIIAMVFSGPLVKVYASTRGYTFCHAYHNRETTLTFVKPKTSCPPIPTSHDA